MNNQGVLFPTDDFRDRSFEAKRAAKVAKKEERQGYTDLIVVLPYRFSEKEFCVSRSTSGKWHCQADSRDSNCSHIRKLKKLLQLKAEAGYVVPDKEWLERLLIVGQVK